MWGGSEPAWLLHCYIGPKIQARVTQTGKVIQLANDKMWPKPETKPETKPACLFIRETADNVLWNGIGESWCHYGPAATAPRLEE